MNEQNDGNHDFPWHLGVFDAHCHPTDKLNTMDKIPQMRAHVLTVMATRAEDQELVADAAAKMGVTMEDGEQDGPEWYQSHKIIPAFGWHPWFSYQMFEEADYDGATSLNKEQKVTHYQSVLTPQPNDKDFLTALPAPRSFGGFIEQTRQYLLRYPLALIGEIGLDKSFRIPEAWTQEHLDKRNDELTPGSRERRKLSQYRVTMDHQRRIVLAQLRLAGALQRAVSMHGVAAHGVVYETLCESWRGHELEVLSKKERKRAEAAAKANANPPEEIDEPVSGQATKPFPPRVCLHSYSGPPETVKQYLVPSVPCEIYFSFSTTISSWSDSGEGKVEAAVRAVPDDRILIESDLDAAGDRIDSSLAAVARKICEVKQWDLDAGVRQLSQNWRRFVFGPSVSAPSTDTTGTAQ